MVLCLAAIPFGRAQCCLLQLNKLANHTFEVHLAGINTIA
jgi:hypothetical protein